MIGLDTNIVVRHLVAHDAAQARRVRDFLAANCTVHDPGFVNRVVLCEVVWVLKRLYRYDRGIIADTIAGLLQAAELRIEDHEAAVEALAAYRRSQADFADCLVGVLNRANGCRSTVTLDRMAAALPEFQPL